MSPSGPSSSNASGSRALRSSSAVASSSGGPRPHAVVASGSGSSSTPSPAKRRRFQSGSVSYPEEPSFSSHPSDVPPPASPKSTPFSRRSPYSLTIQLPPPRSILRIFLLLLSPQLFLLPAKITMPAFGDHTSLTADPVQTRKAQEESVAAAAKSADTVRRFRLNAAEGFFYPKSIHPTQDFPSVEMCIRRMGASRNRLQVLTRDDGPFVNTEYLSRPTPLVELPVWVDPVVDYETGYEDAVRVFKPTSPRAVTVFDESTSPSFTLNMFVHPDDPHGFSEEEMRSLPLASESLPVFPLRLPSPDARMEIDDDVGTEQDSSSWFTPVAPVGRVSSANLESPSSRRGVRSRRLIVESDESSDTEEIPLPSARSAGKKRAREPSGSPDVVVLSEGESPNWRGTHFDIVPSVDARNPVMPPAPLYSSWFTLVRDGPDTLSGFIFLLLQRAKELPASTRPVMSENYCARCVADGVPCTYAVPGVSGRPFADGRAKQASVPPAFSKCTRCRRKRSVCLEARSNTVNVKRYMFSAHFCELIAWIHHLYHYKRAAFNEFQNRVGAAVADIASSSSDSDSPEPLIDLANDEPPVDEAPPQAPPAPDPAPVSAPLSGNVATNPRDRVPIPTMFGLPLSGRRKLSLRGKVWKSTLVPAPALPAVLPPFFGGSHPYRQLCIIEDTNPPPQWADISYRPPLVEDPFDVPVGALAVDVRADSVAGRFEYGRVKEFEDLDGKTLVATFVQLLRRSHHAVMMMTRGIVYALGPKLLRELNQQGTDIDVPRLGATLDGVPLPFPSPIDNLSGDLALHAHLSRMAGAEHPLSIFIRAALETDTMRGYATGTGVLEQSEVVEWEQFAETSLFKHLILKPKKVPNKPQYPLVVFPKRASGCSSGGPANFGVLGRGLDEAADRAEGTTSPSFVDSHMRVLRSSIEETVAPTRRFSPASRSSVAIVDGGNLPDGYRDPSKSPRLPLFFPEPEPPKGAEDNKDLVKEPAPGERRESVVDGIAVLPGASESNDVEVDVPMEVVEPEIDELRGDS
ncbi:hypothetical protein C8F01DRAFT_1248777 [Mycena amicta]|nr:hypothetical protein C8F01DRAFT_1248777 [Mycena amicta]